MELLGSKIHIVSVLIDVALGLQEWLCVKYLRVAVSSIPKHREGKIRGASPREESLQVSTEWMEREIIPETQWPEGRITGDKIATGKGYFKCTNLPMHQVAEIMNLILAISCSSQLGAPLVVQSRPLLGSQLKQGTTGRGKTVCIRNSFFLQLTSQPEGLNFLCGGQL